MDILLEKSLIDCHCKGLDSLVIKDSPNMVRMFIARYNHELWRNDPLEPNRLPFSIALHQHKTDVTLQPIFGDIYNISFSNEGASRKLRSFKYRSPIDSDTDGSFESVDTIAHPMMLGMNLITGPLFLRGNESHTIYVPANKTAAWYVWEGDQNLVYNNIVYSDAALEDFEFANFDKPITEERLKSDLKLIGVYR